jgi:ATP-binding cassette subfamily F protein 3
MQIEVLLEDEQKELIEVSTKGDNSRLIELSTIIIKHEKQIEDDFEKLEEVQTKLDEILEEYGEKLLKF